MIGRLSALDFAAAKLDIQPNLPFEWQWKIAMTDESNTGQTPDPKTAQAAGAKAPDAANENAGQDQAADASAWAKDVPETDPVELLKAENEDLKDRLLRLAAEMENLRRRTARDVSDAKTYSVASFARDMLSVSDNLRRAIDAVPAEARERGEAGLTSLLEGVDLTEREMLVTLGRHGVKKLDPKGQKFDPNFHQAMFEVPNTEVPNNSVIEVVQTGYVIADRVLRPAMVGVAKGGPRQAPEPPETEQAAEAHPAQDQKA